MCFTYWGKENRSLYRGLRYIEPGSRFHFREVWTSKNFKLSNRVFSKRVDWGVIFKRSSHSH